MIPASVAAQRPPDGKLLVIDERGAITHRARADFLTLVRADDVVVANDAATLPASLAGVHLPTGGAVEVRLAGRDSLRPREVTRFTTVVFGAGDFRTPTEHRPPPPALHPGDELQLGPLRAIVLRVLGHPRLIEMRFENLVGDLWEGLARHGRPIQYAYVPDRLAIWDTWTPIASQPVAFEAPSAGFILDWAVIGSLRARGAAFATLTHAAGISSTGDAELDRLLPLDEPYHIPVSTARLIEACQDRGGRVIAVGTTVVRALEHAARADGSVRPGAGTATSASVRPRHSGAWMRSCPAPTNQAPATTICSVRFRLARCFGGWRTRQTPSGIGPTSSATLFSSRAAECRTGTPARRPSGKRDGRVPETAAGPVRASDGVGRASAPVSPGNRADIQ